MSGITPWENLWSAHLRPVMVPLLMLRSRRLPVAPVYTSPQLSSKPEVSALVHVPAPSLNREMTSGFAFAPSVQRTCCCPSG